MCNNGKAPQSITGTPKCLNYFKRFHSFFCFHRITPLNSGITFGDQGRNKFIVRSLNKDIIRVLVPVVRYFSYMFLIIFNDFSTLLGLQARTRLRMVTNKQKSNLRAVLIALNVSIPLQRKFSLLYYEAYCNSNRTLDHTEYLLSMTELAQIDGNLGHAPTGSVYSALRREYFIETGS